jgi:hypothetical protein
MAVIDKNPFQTYVRETSKKFRSAGVGAIVNGEILEGVKDVTFRTGGSGCSVELTVVQPDEPDDGFQKMPFDDGAIKLFTVAVVNRKYFWGAYGEWEVVGIYRKKAYDGMLEYQIEIELKDCWYIGEC